MDLERYRRFEWYTPLVILPGTMSGAIHSKRLENKMALFMKQDFCPPLLSPRWFAMKFRPNLLLHSREFILSILESGLLFREDSAEVEQEAPSMEAVWDGAGVGRAGWLTRGEAAVTGAGLAACVYMCPPAGFSRHTLLYIAAYASIPIAVRLTHRSMYKAPLKTLIHHMQIYLATARRAAAMIKEMSAFCKEIGTLSSLLASGHTLLCRQQSELAVLMSRASSAVLGNSPWLREDIVWEAHNLDSGDNLQQIHHAFMVVQSSLLKHIAMAHSIPSPHQRKLYKNHNERIFFIHNVLIKYLNEQFQQNLDALQRMYRTLKYSTSKGNESVRKPGSAVAEGWIYSDIQNGVARAALELKLALDKSNTLDILLDSCATNNQKIDIDVLDKDIENIIDLITKSLNAVQNSQLRLRNLKNKLKENKIGAPVGIDDGLEVDQASKVITQPVVTDEVFYFVKTEDEVPNVRANDVTTNPGVKERETTKVVLNELRRKLGKREDVMRERERQALIKTMPELKNVPEFPRQIKFDEFIIKKGFITKIRFVPLKHSKLFKSYKIHKNCTFLKKYTVTKNNAKLYKKYNNGLKSNSLNNKKFGYKIKFQSIDLKNTDIFTTKLSTNQFDKNKESYITIKCLNKTIIITKLVENFEKPIKYLNFNKYQYVDPVPRPAGPFRDQIDLSHRDSLSVELVDRDSTSTARDGIDKNDEDLILALEFSKNNPNQIHAVKTKGFESKIYPGSSKYKDGAKIGIVDSDEGLLYQVYLHDKGDFNQDKELKFTRKDYSPSSSDTDVHKALLADIRKNRATRKKNRRSNQKSKLALQNDALEHKGKIDSDGPNDTSELKCTKKDLELSCSSEEPDGFVAEVTKNTISKKEYYPDSTDSDEEELLADIKKNRELKKIRPSTYTLHIDNQDESLKPIEYRLGTGLAMASVLQSNRDLLVNREEEVFAGNGEVSADSGNDEDV